MNLLVFTSLLVLGLVVGRVYGAHKCNTTVHREADGCMQKMFLIGDRTQRFRETVTQMKNYCQQIVDLQKCIKRFSRRCLPELGRQVTNVLLFGVKKINRQYCQSIRGMTSFTKIGKCGNHELDKKHDCMDRFLIQLARVESRAKQDSAQKRTLYICCYFSQFKSCISGTSQLGDSSTRCPSEETKEQVNELIGGYADDALDMVCGDFSTDEDKCATLLTPLHQVQLKSNRTSKSILPYFVNLFNDF